MALIEWPAEQFRTTKTTYHVDWTSRGAGVGLSGSEQIIDTGTGIWRFKIEFQFDHDRTRLRRFEALVREMRGRLNTAVIPLYDAYAYDQGVSPLQERWQDDTFFSDDTGWSAGTAVQPMITTGVAAAGANQITVDLVNPRRPSFDVGDLFTVNGFLYSVVRRNAGGWVKIEPPLRQAIPAGTVLQTTPPLVYAKFATDGEGERARDLLSWGEPVTITFVEDFDR